MKTTYKILIICVFGILMFGIGFFVANQMCPAPVFDEPVLQSIKTYRNNSFRVELSYFPAKNYSRGFDEPGGYPNGFFNITAEGNIYNLNIDDYVNPDHYTIRKNFGNNPVITILTIDGQEARMVTSKDPQNDRAWIIVRYPEPILIKQVDGTEELRPFLAIYTTRLFANDIIHTIKFREFSR